MSMVAGRAGRRNVNVGGVPVPTGAITNLLRTLTERAATELHEFTASEPTGVPLYLLDEFGEMAVDPADDDARAEAVLTLLADSASADEEAWQEDIEDAYDEDYDDADDDDEYDEESVYDDASEDVEEELTNWHLDQIEGMYDDFDLDDIAVALGDLT